MYSSFLIYIQAEYTVAVKIKFPFCLRSMCVRFYNVLKALQFTVPLLITVASTFCRKLLETVQREQESIISSNVARLVT